MRIPMQEYSLTENTPIITCCVLHSEFLPAYQVYNLNTVFPYRKSNNYIDCVLHSLLIRFNSTVSGLAVRFSSIAVRFSSQV